MSKRRKQATGIDKDWLLVWVFITLLAIFMWLPKFGHAATYDKIYEWRDPGGVYDSVLMRIMVGSTVRDTVRAALGDSLYDTVTLDQDSTYFEDITVFFTGNTFWESIASTVLPRWSGGSVSLSTADYDSIETRVADGSGPNSVSIYCEDSAAGTAVSGARVTVRDVTATTNIRQVETGASGTVTFLTAEDSVTVIAEHLPYHVFPTTYDTIVTTVPATVTISGYATDTLEGSISDRTCAVSVLVRDNTGDGVGDVWVSASLTRANVFDSSGAAILNRVQRGRTDSTGVVTFTCLWSSYMIPATDWLFVVERPDRSTMSKRLTVPRTVTHTVDLVSD